MATRKRKSGGRRKTTRARKSTSTALTRRRRTNPASRRRRGSVVARSRRRSVRRRNPSGKLLPLVIGAGISQIGASLIPFGGGPFIEAAKVAGVGWLLERFLGRTVPSVFGEAKEGGMIAGGVLLFNAYLAPTLASAVPRVVGIVSTLAEINPRKKSASLAHRCCTSDVRWSMPPRPLALRS